jgi:hypothetical protein
LPAHGIESAMAEQTRRYSIWILDIEADRDVIFTVVDWIDEEKRAAVEQVLRWTGATEGAGQDFVDMIAPSQPRKPQ